MFGLLSVPTSINGGCAMSTKPGTGTMWSNLSGIQHRIAPSAICHEPSREITRRTSPESACLTWAFIIVVAAKKITNNRIAEHV